MTLSLDAAISGMKTQQQNIESIANNLANVNTSGYKRAKIHFQDTLDAASIAAALGGALDFQDASRSAGVRLGGMTRDFMQGSLQPTGRQMDFAINGDGFFQVRLDDGTLGYARSGVFNLDAEGNVVTMSGQPLDPPLQLPPQFRSLRIEGDGTVSVMRDYTDAELEDLGPLEPRDGVRAEVGRIEIARFTNPQGLESIGHNLYRATELSQEPIVGFPGDDAMGEVLSGWLEASNVDVATEMTGLVMAKRGYQLNVMAYKTIEDMLSEVNNVT